MVTFFLIQGRIRQQKEKDGLHLSFAVPTIQWDFNPTALMSFRLWEIFTFHICGKEANEMANRLDCSWMDLDLHTCSCLGRGKTS